MKRLNDKIAFITGAGGGLGKEVSLHFAREGAKIIASDIRESELEETVEIINSEIEGSTEAVSMDVNNPKSIINASNYVESKFKNIDILVNNAGFLRYNHIFDYTLEDWDRLIDINLRGYFLVTQSFGKLMRKGKNGKIINVSSIAATNGLPGGSAYAASKGGINSMTKVLATDLAQFNINVNAIAPGPIKGEFLNSNSDDAGTESRINKTLFKRLGTYNDIAKPMVFLASSDSDWITGTVIVADGGFTL